ncbi:MAG: rRNA pseudouridine synthase [Zetaproteobacteria bacterium]|nr:MAG: rRNA pseudouridine synthase [Zetaproteobacteria bacterium]
MERLDRLLSRLGYGSRRQIVQWVRKGWVTEGDRCIGRASEKVDPSKVFFRGEPLDHPHGLTIIYHKPPGTICSRHERGRLIYEDFPERWRHRRPAFSPVGRLDKDTSGLLIVTDDGSLNHWLTSPRHRIGKRYVVHLARPLRGDEPACLSSGRLMLKGEKRPCLPAHCRIRGASEMEITVYEGRYHQVRRMFAALGNHVVALQRTAIGHLELGDLAPGCYQEIGVDILYKRISGLTT